MSGDPPTLPPLPTSEALFSPKNSPNLDTIGSPQPRAVSQVNSTASGGAPVAVDDVADIETAYRESGIHAAAERGLASYRRRDGRKGESEHTK